ncbi:hypothetical protein [Spirosoma validum]|uniref:DUF2281 domain-containing protein n=1 Tax=Spirosoma validum TaxID=2771355 RepID=A0A927AX42_9BACT|nr:hypothetical protein [Spirosoma validum]MBD2751332.1 hypothetical protein [Spirosoma validum]
MQAAQYTAQSLYVVYRQLPIEAQQAFRDLLSRETEEIAGYKNTEWLPLSDTSLRELWDAPEEDYWDDLYAKQHAEN